MSSCAPRISTDGRVTFKHRNLCVLAVGTGNTVIDHCPKIPVTSLKKDPNVKIIWLNQYRQRSFWKKRNIGKISSILLPNFRNQISLISLVFSYLGPGFTTDHLETLRVKAIHGCIEDSIVGFRVEYWNGRSIDYMMNTRKRFFASKLNFNVHQLIEKVEVYFSPQGVGKIRFTTSTGTTQSLVASADSSSTTVQTSVAS